VSAGRRSGDTPGLTGPPDAFVGERAAMVAEQLFPRGISDPRVLEAMSRVPRHLFVGREQAERAYDDHPLPIGFGQTISQPYMVARATELALPEEGDVALEIGVGSGYQTAVLSLLCAQVFAVDIVPALVDKARAHLAEAGCRNVTLAASDGSCGWPEHAPYDIIIVSAATPQVPVLLLDELRDGGRLVAPVGGFEQQVLTRVRRTGDAFETLDDVACRYVNLIGRYGVGRDKPQA
jgi:protein-L-isoaspartate(D-aspartate) O-methyltransferase